jgi:hypothetical protein
MNKKTLSVIALILIMATLSTTLVSGVQACYCKRRPKTVETFTLEPDLATGSTPATLFNTQTIAADEVKLVKDDTVQISWGGIMKSEYTGDLGSGYFTRENVYTVRDNPFVSGAKGWGICKCTLEIADGPFGKGTLRGWGYSTISLDSSRVPRYQMWTYTSMGGKLYKDGKCISATVYVEGLTAWDLTYVAYKIWWLKTTIVY